MSFPVPGEMRTEFRFPEMRDERLDLKETTQSRLSKGFIPVSSEIPTPCTAAAFRSVAQSETASACLFCATSNHHGTSCSKGRGCRRKRAHRSAAKVHGRTCVVLQGACRAPAGILHPPATGVSHLASSTRAFVPAQHRAVVLPGSSSGQQQLHGHVVPSSPSTLSPAAHPFPVPRQAAQPQAGH